jgi:glycosyltransferase involved in cell wall biosynthesis
MRIVHVVVTRTPANIQGNERHVAYLAGTQRARGLNAAVVTSGNGLFFNLCEQDGIPAFVVDDLLPSGELTPEPGIVTQEIAAKLKEFNAEIVHCHDLITGKTVMTAANMIGLPCVVTIHEGKIGRIIHQFIAAKNAGAKFTIIVVSKKEYEFAQTRGMAGIDIHYVPNGTQCLPSAHLEERRGSRRPNLMLVGSLSSLKGVDIALLAMVELRRRRGADCPALNIYGAGSLGDHFMEMARVLRLDDIVSFHGVQMNILNRCRSSDILILPSRVEAAPLVILEAMSRGMPIVASDVGDVAEMLPDRRYGRVVPSNSITAFADAVDSLLADIASGQFNPDLLVERHQSQYSIDKMARRIEAIYQAAMLRN